MPHLVAEVAAPGLAVVGRPVGLPVPGEVAAGAVLLTTDVTAVLLAPRVHSQTLAGSPQVR